MNDALPAPGEGAIKQCRRCDETLPVSSFPRNRHGNARPCCHKCTHIERGESRATQPAWRNAHTDRMEREREARRISNEYRQAQKDARRVAEGTKECPGCQQALPIDAFPVNKRGHRQARCKPCANAHARAAYYRKLGRPDSGTARGSIDPEKRREAAERIDHLASLLKGLDPNQRLTSVEEWDVTTSELQKLWHLSGDKECASCGAVVPSTAMRPPGPANFYTGKCNACARIAWEANHRASCGPLVGPLPGPRRLRMRDGSTITVAEFARRHCSMSLKIVKDCEYRILPVSLSL